ncbi:ATP-dependent RNA helicase RhlE [Thalassocella blandensis]|nr:ATP-dependent RNA helicase RhlE [Thalassocella blandensis]
MKFTDLGLCAPILQAIEEKGYSTPTPVQEKGIPAVLQGRDVMAAAQTGTGKTAGFTLPILEILNRGQRARGNHVRCLVLTPTRELAIQVGESVETYGKHLPIKSAVVYGGVKINPQMMRLRGGVDILVATPGRLMDLYQQNAVQFKHLEILVLDEADRMLDMGFIRDIRKIIALLPAKRQNLLFSATFSDDIRDLAKGIIHKPIEFSVTPRNATAKTVKQCIHPVDKKQKPALLSYLIGSNNWKQVLVFARTKAGANRLSRYLDENGIKSLAIHGNKSQGARIKALTEFKSGGIQVLVATDIAARGIDIDQLPHVVNVDLPNVPEDYVHRIGRTGRAGAAGHAVSLVCADEHKQLVDIERLIQQQLPRILIDGFEPVHDVPASGALRPPHTNKPKKPKKPKANKPSESKDGKSGKGGSGKPTNRFSKSKNQEGGDRSRRSKPSQKNTAGGAKNGSGRSAKPQAGKGAASSTRQASARPKSGRAATGPSGKK